MKRNPPVERGLVLVYEGEGEGKTMAAIGHAVRALGHGRKVAVIHFMKGWESGEYKFLERKKDVAIFLGGPTTFLVTEEDRKAHLAKAREAYKLSRKILSDGTYDLVILDEVLYTLKFGLLKEEDVLSLLDAGNEKHLILTGRGATDRILKRADVLTRTINVRHHYETDKRTILGLDY